MKSLDLVNVLIKCSEFITNDTIGISKKTVYQIKQDLEALEILIKLFRNMDINIWKSKLYHKMIGEIKFSGTDFEIDVGDYGVTIEELLKLKQWLEENENDR